MRNCLHHRLAPLVIVILGCVTINVYFPEEEVKDLSEQIEEEVRRRAASGEASEPTSEQPSDEQPASQPEEQTSSLRHSVPGAFVSPPLISRLLGVSVAHAQGSVPEPEITNPAIRRIIASRAERLEALNRHKAMGVIGENNQALVEVRDLQSLTDLRERAEVQRIAREENADREQLFKEVALAKGVDLAQLPLIRRTYAETMRQFARTGDWIQQEDGTWVQKTG
jgi:uncharacterized protein YdbL (DUF1318 family)